MDAVKAFNAELSALYEVKPPISKAKMNSLTRGAIKAIKFYKHVVQSVEKFIQKCKPEYKVPGLYVIDSIVRQSRHQFGVEKDVFAPRFAKNMQTTFLNLLKCPSEDKSKVIRVLNLWQKNAVFPPEVIQPLFDLADPNHPIHKEQTINSNGAINTTANNLSALTSISKNSPGVKGTPNDQKIFSAKPIDPAWLAQTKLEAANMVNANKILGQAGNNQIDVSFLDQLQHLQQLLLKKQETTNEAQTSVKFDKKLLDFDYGEEEDDDVMVANSPTAAATAGQHGSTASGSLESLGMLLTNPEVLRQLQTLQQTMQGNASSSQHEMEEKMRKLQQMKQQEEEFDKHLAQTVPTLPFASECDLKPSDVLKPNQHSYNAPSIMQQDMSQPPPGYPPAFISQPGAGMRQSIHQKSPLLDERQDSQDYQASANKRDSSSVEIVNLDSIRSQSRSPDRYRRHSRSRSPRHRSRGRDRDRDRDRDRKSRSRSRSRRRRSRSRDRKREDSREKISEEEREKQRERRKKGLPPIVREKMSVCSTTLWVGHLSKLVHQEELSDTFGEFGDIVSIDLISPRGCAFICMNRRQDAFRALSKLKNHKMQGKAITLAWAPGKGVKGKEWKDYWEVELGVSYIPWNKLNNVNEHDLELLEEGGMIDEDTLPPRLMGKLKHSSSGEGASHTVPIPLSGAPIPTLTDGMVNVMPSTSGAQQTPIIDTSQPPPIRATTSTGLLPPTSAQLSMMPPGFPMTGVPRMLGPMGISMAHGLMPNVPIGVPPPNMQGLLGPPGMMQSMLTPPVNPAFGTGVGVGLLTQIPMPGPTAPSDKSNSSGIPSNVQQPTGGETNLPNLPMLRQPFGVGPPPPPMQMQIQPQQSDDMDVEMEDAMPQSSSNNPPKDKPNLSDQLLAAMAKGPLGNNNSERNMTENNERDFRDRDRERDRDRRDRNNDRDRDRGRGRDRGRDRRRDRDRDDRRDERRGGDRDIMRPHDGALPIAGLLQEPDLGPKKDKLSLADRLRQLADGTLPMDDRMDRIRERNDRSMERTDRPQPFEDAANLRRPGDGPPSLMDLPKFPPTPGDRDFGPRPDFRPPQDMRDFPRNDRDRGFPPRGNRGPLDDFPDPRMMPARFPDEFDRLGHNGPRPEDFDLRLHPREEFDRRMPVDDYEAERFEFERRQREGFDPRIADGFDPRLHPDHPDFEMRRREFFGHLEPGFGPIINSRGPRGPLVPDAFGGVRPAIGNRGGPHGPPMFHPRGMGPRGMRPGMRQFGPRGPPFDPREGEAFFRAYDEGRGPFRGGPHSMADGGGGPWRGENGPWMDGNNGLVEGDDIVRENHLNTPKGYKHQDRSERDRNSRNRKSRWGNASPLHEQTESGSGENECADDRKSKDHESTENWDEEASSVNSSAIIVPEQNDTKNQIVDENIEGKNEQTEETQVVMTTSENLNETYEEINQLDQVSDNITDVPAELSENVVNDEKSVNSENVGEPGPPSDSMENCSQDILSENPTTEAL